MAIIGSFKAAHNNYTGILETLSIKAELSIEPAAKKNDNQPDYRVFHITEQFRSDIGAAWKKNARDGSQYLSVSIDDPSLPERIFCRLMKTGIEHSHSLYWERPRQKDE